MVPFFLAIIFKLIISVCIPNPQAIMLIILTFMLIKKKKIVFFLEIIFLRYVQQLICINIGKTNKKTNNNNNNKTNQPNAQNPTTGFLFLNKEIGIFLFPQATSKFQVFSEQIQEYTKQSRNNILEIILMILKVY